MTNKEKRSIELNMANSMLLVGALFMLMHFLNNTTLVINETKYDFSSFLEQTVSIDKIMLALGALFFVIGTAQRLHGKHDDYTTFLLSNSLLSLIIILATGSVLDSFNILHNYVGGIFALMLGSILFHQALSFSYTFIQAYGMIVITSILYVFSMMVFFGNNIGSMVSFVAINVFLILLGSG